MPWSSALCVTLVLWAGVARAAPSDGTAPMADAPPAAPRPPTGSGLTREVPLSALRALLGQRVHVRLAGGATAGGRVLAVDEQSLSLVSPDGQVLSFERAAVFALQTDELAPPAAALDPAPTAAPARPAAAAGTLAGPLRTRFQLDVKTGLQFWLTTVTPSAQVLLGASRGHFTGSLAIGFRYNEDSSGIASDSFYRRVTEVSLAPTVTIDAARFARDLARVYVLVAVFGGYSEGSNPTVAYSGSGNTSGYTQQQDTTFSGGLQLGLGLASLLGRGFQLGLEAIFQVQHGVNRSQTVIHTFDGSGGELPTLSTSTSGESNSVLFGAFLVGTFRAGD